MHDYFRIRPIERVNEWEDDGEEKKCARMRKRRMIVHSWSDLFTFALRMQIDRIADRCVRKRPRDRTRAGAHINQEHTSKI